MRSARVLFKKEPAGELTQLDDGSFVFTYDAQWLLDGSKPPISLTLPKSKVAFHSKFLFPFFFNFLPEGANKHVICRKKRIDNEDYFGLLLEVGHGDTVGAVQIQLHE